LLNILSLHYRLGEILLEPEEDEPAREPRPDHVHVGDELVKLAELIHLEGTSKPMGSLIIGAAIVAPAFRLDPPEEPAGNSYFELN